MRHSAEKARWATASLRRVVIGLGLLATLIAIACWQLPAMLSLLIVSAPNSGRTIDPRADPPTTAPFAAVGRTRVGSPEVSLFYRVMNVRKQPPRGTVLLFHGIRSQGTALTHIGRDLVADGLRVVLVDSRGHGRSTGNHLTYGVRESRDARQLVAHLRRSAHLQEPIAAVGFSYGGAVALQLGAHLPSLRAVIAVSTFASLSTVVPAYMRRLIPWIGDWMAQRFAKRAVANAGSRAGFNPAQADNLVAVANSTAALLVIHGGADTRIPPQHAQRIYRASREPRRLVIVPGADHGSILGRHRATVKREVRAWLHRWLIAAAPARR